MDAFIVLVIRLLVFIIGVVSLRPRWMTMSMPVIPDDVGLSVPYTVDELMAIVDVHNQERSNVTPSAADMEYMYWNEELAAAADGWAVKCTLEHGKPENSTISRFGQNIWAGFGISKWALPETISPFRAWNNEDRFYDYSTNSCKKDRMCGHYTQIVWASTQTIGCGRAFCKQNEDLPFDRWIVVCNYSPGGNIQGRQPYIAGPSCSRCSSGNGQCYENKCRPCFEHTESCDCNLQCQNCGTLDRDTCTCSCPKGWHGNECGKPCVDTHKYCGKSPGWPARFYCPFASYIPRYCPLMCGICEAADPNFVCEENSTDGDWQTTDAMTTEAMEDDVTTDMTTSYDDVTTGMTTSNYDISTTPFPMTTTPGIDIVTDEIVSASKGLEEVPAEKTDDDYQGISTTPSTKSPDWLETLREITDSDGKRVNYAAKSIDSGYSDELRSLVRNASYDALKENVEISAHNGILIDRKVDAIDPDDGEMEFIPTTQQHESTSSASSSSNETDSKIDKSTGADSFITKTTEDYPKLTENKELVTSSPDLTESSQPTTTSFSPLSMATTFVQDFTERPSSMTRSERHHETTLLISTGLSVGNSMSKHTGTSSTATTMSSEVLTEAMPTTTIQTDTRTTRNNNVPAIGISTEATSAKYLSTLNSTNNFYHTIKEGDESTTGVSEGLTNVPVVLGGKEYPKQLGLVSEHLCRKTFTAAAVNGQMLFLFRGQHLWRVNVSSGQTLSEKETVQSYFGLDGQKVTAAFYRPDVDEWNLFTYIDVFIIRNPSQTHQTPFFLQIRVKELGIPFGVVVDAAFHDDRRKKSYLFTNRWVWRYDDERGELDVGYPRRGHHEFPGLQRHRPSAVVTLNGTHYILYGNKYMTIDKDTHQVDERRGGNFLDDYFGCFSGH